MQSTFGRSFAGIRLHTDAAASRLSSEQNARAFTVAEDVAFAAGEYRPGTVVGDALIAHELAHTIQQRGRPTPAQAPGVSDASYGVLEDDADQSAVAVVASLWGAGTEPAAATAHRPHPALTSGLRLQRCGSTRSSTRPPASPGARQAATPAGTSATQSGTPCPTSVRVGALVQRNFADLSASQKEEYGTWLGAMSLMEVGPGPDHTGHCMKERLTRVTNTCPAGVYTRNGRTIEPCTGNKCLDINRGRSFWGLTDGPTSFLDMHRTTNRSSLLEGTGVNSCTVVCEQAYTCDRVHPTTGVFLITRNYQADTYRRPDGTSKHVTTGSVTKTERTGSTP
jgi:Domain of unknown function (DUF4157)